MTIEILANIAARMPSFTNRFLARTGILTNQEVEVKTTIENARSNLTIIGNEFPQALESARQLVGSYNRRLNRHFTAQISQLAVERKELMGYGHATAY